MKIKERNILWIILAGLVLANLIVAALLTETISEKRRLEVQFSENGTVPENLPEEINILLPETVYAVRGITMEIYNTQATSLGKDISKYNVLWKCETGENLERKFSVTADETMSDTYELTLEIYNNELERVAQKTCTLQLLEGDSRQKAAAEAVTKLSEAPSECLEQVKVCVDTAYHGSLEKLEPEGVEQLQDIVYSVLCGLNK